MVGGLKVLVYLSYFRDHRFCSDKVLHKAISTDTINAKVCLSVCLALTPKLLNRLFSTQILESLTIDNGQRLTKCNNILRGGEWGSKFQRSYF